MSGELRVVWPELYVKTGSIDKAKDAGNKSIKNYEKTLGEDHWETTKPMYNLTNALMIYDELDEAEELAIRTYNIRKKALGKKHPLFASSSNQLAILNWKKGNTDKALGYYKETFENYFNQINTFFPVLTEEEKATFYYTNLRPAFEQYVSFIEETSSENKELLGEIYDYQLALKGLIMYATSKVRESILASGDENLIEMFEDWISQKEQLAKLFSATDLAIEVRNRRIDSLTLISDKLEEELGKSSQAFGKNFASKSYSWRNIKTL